MSLEVSRGELTHRDSAEDADSQFSPREALSTAGIQVVHQLQLE